MEHRILEIKVLSANDLKNPNPSTKMDAYAVLTLSGDPSLSYQRFKTHVDRKGGNNPTWNSPVMFLLDQAAVNQNQLMLTFIIRCDVTQGDNNVGAVLVPLKELLDDVAAADTRSTTTQMKPVTYQVWKPSGKTKGELHFSYKFSKTEKYPYTDVAVATTSSVPVACPMGTKAVYQPPPPPLPTYAYPVQQNLGNVYGGYPPPPPAHAYPPQQYPGNIYGGYPPLPPQPAYGYPPPPPAGYVYAQPQQPQNTNNLGLKLGAGLLVGAVRLLVFGDWLSGGGGFGDGWGF